MKRLIAIALALLLLLPGMAYLEEAPATEFASYTEVAGRYTIPYPAQWQVLDRETLLRLTEAALPFGELLGGFDTETLESYLPLMEDTPVVSFAEPFSMSNCNITYSTDPSIRFITGDILVNEVAPHTLDEFKTAYKEAEALDEGSLVTIGEFEFLRVTIRIGMFSNHLQVEQYILPVGDTLYVITFTFLQQEGGTPPRMATLMQEMLAGFVPLAEQPVKPRR